MTAHGVDPNGGVSSHPELSEVTADQHHDEVHGHTPASLGLGAEDDVTHNDVTLTDLYYAGDLIEVGLASCYIRVNGSSPKYMKAGDYTVTITANYALTQAPTLDCSLGSLGSFSGSGKVWTATLTITDEDGTVTFSNAQLVNGAGTGTSITSGATHYADTTAPTIVSASIDKTDWRGNDGSIKLTIECGETTTGWTGTVNLSAWGGSSSQSLSVTGTTMYCYFSPDITDAGPAYITGINVFDRAGNAATNNNYSSSNQLTTHGYRVEQEDLHFPAYSAVSEVLSASQTFTTTADVEVVWGVAEGQFWPTGTLTYGVDYTIDDNNKIHLDETLYASEIAGNSLGAMFVVVKEY